MTTNQTIDGVPRELMERACVNVFRTTGGQKVVNELRALMDAPAYPNRLCHIDYTAHPYICGCLKGDEEAQRRYDEKFGKPAAQPQCESVAWSVALELFWSLEDAQKAIRNPDITPKPLYAEQPAPVAVTLQQVLTAYEYAESHPHK